MRKLFTIAFIAGVLSLPAFATSFGAKTYWVVSASTGSDTVAGGAFDPGVGSPGTDETTASAVSCNITLASGTTGTGGCTISSTTNGPGNFVVVTGGSGCSTGTYEILSQSGGTATFNTTMGSSTDVCTAYLGGQLATPAHAVSLAISGNSIYIQTGSYTNSSTWTFNSNAVAVIQGFGTTYGDNGTAPTITDTASPFILTGGSQMELQNLTLVGSGSPAIGIAADALGFMIVDEITMSGGFGKCFDGEDGAYGYWRSIIISRSKITGCTTYVVNNNGAAVIFIGDNLPSNPGSGSGAVYNGSPLIVLDSTMGGTGGSGAAFNCNINYSLCIFDHVTAEGSGGSNIQAGPSGSNGQFLLANSIVYGAGAYGISSSAGSFPSSLLYNNAFGANSSGNQGGGGGAYPSNNQVNLSASPFTSSTNLALNSTSGGGAACKAAGYPGVIEGAAWTGYFDIGGAQSQASSGGSSSGPFGYIY